MAETEMLTVFSYDVADDRRRRRVSRVLEDAAVRVQKSVFETILSEPAATRLAKAAARHLGPGDSLRVYAVSATGRRRTRAFGASAPMLEGDYYLL